MKRKLYNTLYFLSLVLSFECFAQSGQIDNKVAEKEIMKELNSLENLDIKKFIDKMESISKKTADYIKIREQRCSGDFTSFIIDGKGNKKFQTNKLTKAEKRLCQYNLINFQINAMKIVHKAREGYLLRSHKAQLKELSQLNREQIFVLEKAAQKYKK